jgi:putative peptidoglycan lipid II flippase
VSSLLRSNLVVAAGTAFSRLTGLLRVFVFGYVIGQTALGDAYSLANETPNIVYDLLLGGVLSASLVPLFSSFMAIDDPALGLPRDRAADEHATNVVITTAVTLMLALTAIAVLAAPLIFRLYSLHPSPDVDPELFRRVGTVLTRIFLIQILFYGLTGIANAYLNSRRRFLAAAWSPILPNLIIVATLLSLPAAGERRWALDEVLSDQRLRWTLGLGATLGIAAMAAIVVPAMVRSGLRFRPAWDWKHPAVSRLLRLSGWTIGFVLANQVAVVVVRNLALGLAEGRARAYFDAFTWFVLPHGLLAVSISTTFQPEMARAVARKDRGAFVAHVTSGTRLITLLTLPAAAGLIVLREPIIGLMKRGQYDDAAIDNTATALAGLAIGLVGFSVYLFALRGFYAHQDTRTPFVINIVENAINIGLAFLLVRWWGLFGLGLSYAVAYIVCSVWALRVLSRKVRCFRPDAIGRWLWRPLLATVLMAEAMWVMTHAVQSDTGWSGLAQLLVGGGIGLAVYTAVLTALGVPELATVASRLPGLRRR